MEFLDIKTVMVSYIISNLLCAILFLMLWQQNHKRFGGFGSWMVGFVLQFFGMSIITLRGFLPEIISILLGNVLLISGMVLLFRGLEQFVEKQSNPVPNLILIVIFTAIHSYFSLVSPNLNARMINFSTVIFLISLQCAWLLLRKVDASMVQISKWAGIVFIIVCVVNLAQILINLAIPESSDFFHSGSLSALFIMAYQMLFILLTLTLTLTVNQRLIRDLESDIEKRNRVEHRLQQSEALYRQMFDNQSALMMLIDYQTGSIINANEASAKFYGYPVEKLKEMNIQQINALGSDEIAKLRKELISENMNTFVVPHRLASGEMRTVKVFSVPIQTDNQNLNYSILHDITEQQRAQDALSQRNLFLSNLHQLMLDLINRRDIEEIVQSLLQEAKPLLRAPFIRIEVLENDHSLVTYSSTPDQLFKKDVKTIQSKNDWLKTDGRADQTATLHDNSNFPQHHELFEGNNLYAALTIPIKLSERVIGIITFLRDEANRPFDQFDTYMAQQLAQMTALVIDNAFLLTRLQSELTERQRAEEALVKLATIEERQRMARDLHDSANQSIHSLVLFSETLNSTLEKNNIDRAKQIAVRMQESARQALKETRLMLYELQPSSPDRKIDLIPDLEARLAKVERYAGVKAQIVQEGNLECYPRAWHENLFWITIEALNNTLKHAQAHAIKITIRCTPETLGLEITDDGKGYDTNKPRIGGYGLKNMRERAALLGGELTINSTPGSGTCIQFTAKIKDSL